MKLLGVIVSLIIPPVAVFLRVGTGFHFWVSIILTLIGYVPGLVHAIWVVTTDDKNLQVKY